MGSKDITDEYDAVDEFNPFTTPSVRTVLVTVIIPVFCNIPNADALPALREKQVPTPTSLVYEVHQLIISKRLLKEDFTLL